MCYQILEAFIRTFYYPLLKEFPNLADLIVVLSADAGISDLPVSS